MWARAALAAILSIGPIIITPLDKVDFHVIPAMALRPQAIAPLQPMAASEYVIIFRAAPDQDQRFNAFECAFSAVYEVIKARDFYYLTWFKSFWGDKKGLRVRPIGSNILRRSEPPIEIADFRT